MSSQTFDLVAVRAVKITIDDALTPDDEWRSVFYNYRTLKEMAQHIVYNRVVQGFASVEGIAAEDEAKYRITIGEGNVLDADDVTVWEG